MEDLPKASLLDTIENLNASFCIETKVQLWTLMKNGD